jgi:serine acetyltransferase
VNRILMDINFAHKRRWPGRPMTPASCSWLLLSSPGLHLLLLYRICYWLNEKLICDGKYKWFWSALYIFFVVLLKWIIQVNTKSCIFFKDCNIEGSVSFSDQGYIIYSAQETGTGTVIGTRVTVGMSAADKGRPVIGRNVWIGSDCVIHGAISIGDGATILPCTVLTKSIPAGVVMQGNPARLVLRNFDNFELRMHRDIDAIEFVDSKKSGLNV